MEGKKWESVCAVINGDESMVSPSASPLQIRAETVEVASELHLWRAKRWKGCVDQGPQHRTVLSGDHRGCAECPKTEFELQ